VFFCPPEIITGTEITQAAEKLYTATGGQNGKNRIFMV
jgi:hypothetical protein